MTRPEIKIILPVLLLLAIMYSGCMRVIMLAYGVKQPKVMSEKQMKRQIEKFDLENYEHYAITEEGVWKLGKKDASFNKLEIYNKSGLELIPVDTSDCGGDVSSFIQFFKDSANAYVCDTCKLSNIIGEFRKLDGSKLEENLLDREYLAIIYWASFVGRLNKGYTKAWNELFIDCHDDVRVINVSQDVREFWTSAEEY